MRLTLLQMTFGKHIERKHVCFFAGEVGSSSSSFFMDRRESHLAAGPLGRLGL
jgi:hypothetical protein